MTQIDTWDELNALPVGSQIEFDLDQGKSTAGETGKTIFELRENGWYVVADTTKPMFVGFGPLPSAAFGYNYEEGDHFDLVKSVSKTGEVRGEMTEEAFLALPVGTRLEGWSDDPILRALGLEDDAPMHDITFEKQPDGTWNTVYLAPHLAGTVGEREGNGITDREFIHLGLNRPGLAYRIAAESAQGEEAAA